ncbi:MAG: PEP-CTERM sorting domain-containing protein [Planctomycetes bacterium]|nr:PEP-CTERM sorting domain-containing protein [Planctomycetota bacterium]
MAMLPEGGHATSDPVVLLSSTDLVPDPGFKSFQIRDLTRAMTIYGTNAEIDAALTGFGVGDIIDISGYTAHVGGALVLTTGGTVGGFAVSGRTSTAPMPFNAVYVSPSGIAQSFESNLVCLQNVTFDGTGVFAAGFDYALSGGSAMVRIATDELGLSGLAIPTGPLNITGIVIPSFSGEGYCLAPRGIDDIVLVPEPATMLLLGLGGMFIRTARVKVKSANFERREK